jgi:hypothetical protein
MSEMHTALDRLERRIEDQTARIDALYDLLEVRGILPHGADAGRFDALFDDEEEALDLTCGWKDTPRRLARFHVGEATGV